MSAKSKAHDARARAKRALDHLNKKLRAPILPPPDSTEAIANLMDDAQQRGILPKTDYQSQAYGHIERVPMKYRDATRPGAPSIDGTPEALPHKGGDDPYVMPMTAQATVRALDTLDDLVASAWAKVINALRRR